MNSSILRVFCIVLGDFLVVVEAERMQVPVAAVREEQAALAHFKKQVC
jgi:hypothetical protein